jgi:hypothetical protein
VVEAEEVEAEGAEAVAVKGEGVEEDALRRVNISLIPRMLLMPKSIVDQVLLSKSRNKQIRSHRILHCSRLSYDRMYHSPNHNLILMVAT